MNNHDKIKEAFGDIKAPDSIMERVLKQESMMKGVDNTADAGAGADAGTVKRTADDNTSLPASGKIPQFSYTGKRIAKKPGVFAVRPHIIAAAAVFVLVFAGLFMILIAQGGESGGFLGFGSESALEDGIDGEIVDDDASDADIDGDIDTDADQDDTAISDDSTDDTTDVLLQDPDDNDNDNTGLAIEVTPQPVLSNTITVSTPQELADAIAPDTHIFISEGIYDLSAVTQTSSRYVSFYRDSEFGAGIREKAGLLISGVDGLTLQAQDGAYVELVTPDRFAEVLLFVDCRNISLIGFEAGHTVTGDYECEAGVVYFDRVSGISVEGCLFYGCGSIGMRFNDSISAMIYNTVITDCSLRAVDMRASTDIMFADCRIYANRGQDIIIGIMNSSAEFYNCEIYDNAGMYNPAVSFYSYGLESDGSALFDNCVFRNNTLNMNHAGVSGLEPMFMGSGISLKDCDIELGDFAGYFHPELTAQNLGGNTFR